MSALRLYHAALASPDGTVDQRVEFWEESAELAAAHLAHLADHRDMVILIAPYSVHEETPSR